MLAVLMQLCWGGGMKLALLLLAPPMVVIAIYAVTQRQWRYAILPILTAGALLMVAGIC